MTRSLDELERLRLDDPKACLRELLAYPRAELRGAQLVRFLTILGSTYRRLVHLPEASYALHGALRLSEELGLHSMQADVLLKLAHLEYEKCRLHRSIWLTQKALCLYEIDQDEVGIGAALLDYAVWLYHEGNFTLAERALESAKPKIEASDFNRLLMHCLTQAMVCEAQQDWDTALRLLEQGREWLPLVSKTLIPPIFVASARVKKELGEYVGATEEFLRASEAYFESGHIVASALASIDAISILLDLGKRETARSVAQGMSRHVFPLAEESPMAEAAVVKLIELARRGKNLDDAVVVSARDCLTS